MSGVHTPGLFGLDIDIEDLVALARTLFPHDAVGDGPYRRSVASALQSASREPRLWRVLREGLRDWTAAHGRPSQAPPESILAALGSQQGTEFFARLRTEVAFSFYDDHEVWRAVGYPGSSFELGGYLNRGFNDLSWLPEPRTTELAERRVEIGPLPYPVAPGIPGSGARS